MPINRTSVRRRPRRIVARTVSLAGTALLAAALVAWSPTVATGWNQSSAEATLWQLMNGARANNGLRVLQQNGTLVSLARWRSKDEVQRNYFAHQVLGTPYEVYHWYDLNGLSYRWGGENIGWNNGYADADSPVAIHEGFMASPGHRANILEPSWTHGGVGAFAADNVSFLGSQRSPRFFTELFMQALGSAPPPPPANGPPPPPRSGGGGGGSGRPTSAAPASPKTTDPHQVSVSSPIRPRSGQPLNGATAVPISGQRLMAPSKLALLAFVDNWMGAAQSSPELLATTGEAHADYRIVSATAAQRGLFETVLGSLLGGLLG